MPSLDSKTKEEILKAPINELGLDLADSDIAPAVEKLYQELEAVGIKFRPLVYFSDDWGCPDGIPVIGIPFYLAHKRLREIEKEKIGKIEEGEEIQQILRHEAGHAFNYAFSLHKLSRWQKIFGIYDKPYEDNFAPIVGSGKFVRHLEGWYAQKHPDEDFAETFAALITPGLDWQTIYHKTRALKKLTYAKELIKDFGTKPEQAFEIELDVPIESLSLTLENWYKERLATPRPSTKIIIIFDQSYPQRRPFRDEVIGQVKEALLKLNHAVVLLPISQSIEKITRNIRQEKPDLIFNLCETFRNNNKFDYNVAALLEMTKAPFSGSGSRGLFLSQDKHLSKQVFDFYKINYPPFFIVPQNNEVAVPKNFSFPLFVKPVHQDASIGVDQHSVALSEETLKEKIKKIHQEINDDALVENYIEGREFFVSLLGNEMLKPLQLVELEFTDRWPKDYPKIYTQNAKVETSSPEFSATKIKLPVDLPMEVQSKFYDLAIAVFHVLGLRDYARVDMRLASDGKIFVLEANANPYLAHNAETAFAAQASGLNYEQLIAKIVETAMDRARKNKAFP